MRILLTFWTSYVFPSFAEMRQKLRMQMFVLYKGLPEIMCKQLCNYLCQLLGANEVSKESWQLVTAIGDEVMV